LPAPEGVARSPPAQRDPTYGPSQGGLEVAVSREMSSHR